MGSFQGVRARAAVLAVAVAAVLPVAVAPAAWGGDPDADVQELPDLAPRPASGFWVYLADTGWFVDQVLEDPLGVFWPEQIEALRFHTGIRNVGDHSFEITGVPGAPQADGSQAIQALQCVQWTGPVIHGAQRTCETTATLGTMSWHAYHGHLHLDDFARYELRYVLADGSVDYSEAGLAAGGEKTGFCVQDGFGRNPDRPPVEINPTMYTPGWDNLTAWYKGCGQPGFFPYVTSIRQGLTPGWLDVYYSSYPGQQVITEGLPDGRYALVTRINPRGVYRETDLGNNVSVALVELYHDDEGKRQARPLD